MTTNQSLYKSVLDILRKDERGEAVSVAEFNALLPVVSHEYFAQQYQKFQQTQNITDSLAPFITTATVTLTAGAGSLPVDYLHLIGKPLTVTGSYPVDIVTRLEYAERAIDPITGPTATYPIAVVGASTINVYPTTVASITIAYLKDPATPKLDYYVTDATNVRTFLAAAATHTVLTGETYPIAATAPTVGATYTSTTVEMEWLAQDRPSILYLFLQKLGVTMNDQLTLEAGFKAQQINDRP